MATRRYLTTVPTYSTSTTTSAKQPRIENSMDHGIAKPAKRNVLRLRVDADHVISNNVDSAIAWCLWKPLLHRSWSEIAWIVYVVLPEPDQKPTSVYLQRLQRVPDWRDPKQAVLPRHTKHSHTSIGTRRRNSSHFQQIASQCDDGQGRYFTRKVPDEELHPVRPQATSSKAAGAAWRFPRISGPSILWIYTSALSLITSSTLGMEDSSAHCTESCLPKDPHSARSDTQKFISFSIYWRAVNTTFSNV